MSNPSSARPGPPTRGSLLVIFLTVFIDLLGFGIVLPLLPIYGKRFAESHGLSDQQVGWTIGLLMASFSAMQFLFLPIWGRLSDRFGRRPILIMGLVGSTFFYAMFGVATVLHSLAGLFIARLGAGIAGATISTAQAYIADTTTKEKRAKGMALIGAAFALGFTLGPTIGAIARLAGGGDALSPWPGYAASAMSGVALLLAIFKLPESHTPGRGETAVHRDNQPLSARSAWAAALATPSIVLLLATSFVAVLSFGMFESSLSLQIEDIYGRYERGEVVSPLMAWLVAKLQGVTTAQPDQLVVFVAFAYLGVVLTLAQGFLVRRLATRLSEATMAVGGAITSTIGFALLAMAASWGSFGWLLVAMAVEVTGFAFVNPSLQSLISRRTSPALQGGVLGLAQSCTSLARIVGPVVGLRLFADSPMWTYTTATVVLAIGIVMIAFAARSGRDYVGPTTTL
jgi:MFS family permease